MLPWWYRPFEWSVHSLIGSICYGRYILNPAVDFLLEVLSSSDEVALFKLLALTYDDT